MKVGVIILIGAALLVAVAVAVQYLAHRGVESRIGPQHIYELSGQLGVLSEELAIAKARETLMRDGLDISSWREPTGTRQVTSNRVTCMFTNDSASTRFVHVNLEGRRVVCQISVGK